MPMPQKLEAPSGVAGAALNEVVFNQTQSLRRARSGLQVFVDPVKDCVEPQVQVLGFQDPVALVGEDQELRVDAFSLHGGEELHAFADRDAEVLLAVNDHDRRVEALYELVR